MGCVVGRIFLLILRTEIRSPGRLRQVLPILGGLAHDRSRSADDPLQQALIADVLEGNTVFVRGEALAGSAASVAPRLVKAYHAIAASKAL